MEKVRVGIIGTGFTIGIAKRHVEAYTENSKAELVALYDIVEGRTQIWAEKQHLKNVHHCKSLEELLSMVDAVSICTPNYTHAELIVQCLKADKHILCEKPFAPTCEDAQIAVEEADKHPELVSMICFNYREIPAIKYMKQIIDEGKIGRVFTVRQKLGGARMCDPTNVKLEWRMQRPLSGSGALGDFSCHMLDIAEYLLADTQGKITEVTGIANTYIPERTLENAPDQKGPVTNDDCAVFFAQTENGAIYNFVASRTNRPGHYLEISGEGGYLLYDTNTMGDEKIELHLKDKNGKYENGARQVVDVPKALCTENGHRGIINSFVDCILENKRDPRDLHHGLYVQNIIDKVDESAKRKQTVSLY